MPTEVTSRDSSGLNTGLSVLVSALGIFLVLYPSVLFLAGFQVVTLVYGLIPAVGGAILIAGWAIQQEYSVRHLWRFAIVFIFIAGGCLVVYRLIVEPLFFRDVYELQYLFERFRIGVRIGVLCITTAIAWLVAQ